MMPYMLGIGENLKEILENTFKINLWELLINVSATILLILLVRFVFWNKVTKFLDSKKNKIKEEYEESSEIKEEALNIKKEADETLAKSKEQAKSIIKDAEDSATKTKNQIIKDAESKADEIIIEAKRVAEGEKEKAIREAKDSIVDIASTIAESILEKEIDSDKYNESILDEIGSKDE